MRRYTSLWLVAALLLAAAPASAGEVSDRDRFELWNDCKPMLLRVSGLPDDAAEIGLTKEAIEIAVRSRLRGARLYSENFAQANLYADLSMPTLSISVGVGRTAYSLEVLYSKYMFDPVTDLHDTAITWVNGAAGTHGGDPNYVLSTLAQGTDLFIDEYLRVNAEACD